MKTWTMPKVVIEEYAANDYVAACSWDPSGNIIISCAFSQGENWSNPTHDYVSGTCTDTMVISGATWSTFKRKGTWFGSNGTWSAAGGANNLPNENVGEHVYYCYVTTHGGKDYLIWDTYTWRNGSYDPGYSNPAVQKHRTGMGAGGNPES